MKIVEKYREMSTCNTNDNANQRQTENKARLVCATEARQSEVGWFEGGLASTDNIRIGSIYRLLSSAEEGEEGERERKWTECAWQRNPDKWKKKSETKGIKMRNALEPKHGIHNVLQ